MKYFPSFSLALLFITLSGCSTIQSPVMPNGNDRTPINTTNQIESYKSNTAEEVTRYNENTALNLKINNLNQQIYGLKVYATLLEANAESSSKKQPSTIESTVAPLIKSIGNKGESIEVRNQSIIFRKTHPIGKTQFTPSSTFEEQLIKAAKNSKHIEIRGRTDAKFDNEINRIIALERAFRVRKFLILHGIDAHKIRLSSMPSGGHIAENITSEGRAQNRRVEIETMDLDISIFNNDGKNKTGSKQ
jgi:outer membrane protein OmpA-like peptidoglycan-associated protein